MSLVAAGRCMLGGKPSTHEYLRKSQVACTADEACQGYSLRNTVEFATVEHPTDQVDKEVVENFALVVKALSGKDLLWLDNANKDWTCMDVIRRLEGVAPLSELSQEYMLVSGQHVLRSAMLLREIVWDKPGPLEISAVIIVNEWATKVQEAKKQFTPSHGLTLELTTFKNMKHRVHPTLVLASEVACRVLGVEPEESQSLDDNSKVVVVKDYWLAAQRKLFANPDLFLKMVQDFEPRAYGTSQLLDLLSPYASRADFDPTRSFIFSRIGQKICHWCHALHGYCQVAENAMCAS
mmetsp:Transcript_100776/g.178811  ORF Transcript_100776/g.178811 Transcript_100776/m.178811 type:complete len:294 (+) Transcript_100776:63-944(+)